MLEKETLNDKIEVVQTGNGFPVIQIRTATIIKDDGEEISRNFHRKVLNPDADLTEEDSDVTKVATAVFTAKVKAAYQEYLDSLTPKIVAEAVE
jgi:hypothetical protein